MSKSETTLNLTFAPLTPDTWEDLETVFGPRGGTGGCWCMYWRLKNSEFEEMKGDGNKQALHKIVSSGEVPGILAYHDGLPVGWCSIAPRQAFPRLGRSRVLKPVDEEQVWSVVCFFIVKGYRRQGLSEALLQAAVDYAKSQGAKIIEGYPVEPKNDVMPDVFAWTGFSNAFSQAGFQEVARRSETRPFMRFFVED